MFPFKRKAPFRGIYLATPSRKKCEGLVTNATKQIFLIFNKSREPEIMIEIQLIVQP